MFSDIILNPDNFPVFQVLLAGLLGAFIGLERELAGKDPSLRTFALICMGSCVFSVVSQGISVDRFGADPGRIAAQIVSGIGFLGAGAIFRSARGVSGLTTAALMWVTAAIGMSVGFGHISLAVATTFASLLFIFSLQWVHKIIRIMKPHRGVTYSLDDEDDD